MTEPTTIPAATPASEFLEPEPYARVSLYTEEMTRRFKNALRYEENKISPTAKIIKAIANYHGVDLETDGSKGFQHLGKDCYLIAEEDPHGAVTGRRYLMSAEELRSNFYLIH